MFYLLEAVTQAGDYLFLMLRQYKFLSQFVNKMANFKTNIYKYTVISPNLGVITHE